MASASPSRDYDDQDEDEPSSLPSDSQDLTPAINCDVAGENGMYGQFTWTVALPAAPADKDSLADISKIRQFRYVSMRVPPADVGAPTRSLRWIGCVCVYALRTCRQTGTPCSSFEARLVDQATSVSPCVLQPW